MRTLILKKVLQSLGIFLSCVLLIYTTSACDGNLADTTQDINSIQGLNEVTERDFHDMVVGGGSAIGALVSISNGQLVQTSPAIERQGKRKEREKTSHRHAGNGSIKDNQRSKRGKVDELSITSEQSISTSSPWLIERRTNKRKEREKNSTKEAKISIAKGSKRLKMVKVKQTIKESDKEKEREETSIIGNELLSPLTKARIEAISTQQDDLQNMDGSYSTMEVHELAKLANNNDTQAQEEIIKRCLKGTMAPLLASLINPSSWEGIKEKAYQDERYVYLLLHFSKQVNDSSLYVRLLDRIKAYAEAGDPLAQTNLGYMYERGIGIKIDRKKTVELYTTAANQGFSIAQKLLGDMRFRDLVTDYSYKQYDCKNMTEYNEKKAVELYTQAAKQGYAPALTGLGYLYQKARKIYRRYGEAIRCYEGAAAQGDTQAKFHLGETYYHGEMTSMHYRGVATNYEKAFKWYSEAADEGHADAQEMLGLMYNNGEVVKRDHIKAAEWYRKAAEGGSKAGQGHMGIIYEEGRGVPKDLAQAVYWYMRAKERSSLFGFFKRTSLSSLTGVVSEKGINEIEDNLLSSWQAILLQEGQNQVNKYTEAYRQLREIMDRFKEWRLALAEQAELMITCLQFREQQDRIAIETRQKETGVIPYVKQHTLHNNEYLSFGENNVEIAEAIVSELTDKILYNQVQSILNQIAEKNETAKGMQEEQVKQFDRYYTLFLEEIEQGQYARNQKFQEKHPYFFRTY